MTEQSFLTVDEWGSEHRINIHTASVVMKTRGGTHSREGRKVLLTDDGEHVNYIQAGIYEILSKSGRTIRVVACDPDAP